MINTKAVKHRMVDLDLTNARLAHMCDVSAAYMCSVVNGAKPLTLGMALKLKKALVVSDDDFCHFFMREVAEP